MVDLGVLTRLPSRSTIEDGAVNETLEPILFDQDEPSDRGRAHGETWKSEIRELVDIRTELTIRNGAFVTAKDVWRVAGLHLPVLQAQSRALHAELLGIAEAADVTPEELIVLNHFPELLDLPGSVLRPATDAEVAQSTAGRSGDDRDELAGSTAIYIGGSSGPVLGQTWDTHASAEPFVRLIRIAPRHGDREALLLTLTGSLGLVGIGDRGVGVTINNLTCTDAKVGLIGSARVRTLVDSASAQDARTRLERTPLSSGNFYMLADGREFLGIETSGELVVLTQKGARAAHIHTNHCFDPVLRKRERVAPASSTFARMNMATTLFAQQRPSTADELWDLLGSHDGYPQSLCSHVADVRGDDAAVKTCARVLIQPAIGELRVAAGCARSGSATSWRLDRFKGS